MQITLYYIFPLQLIAIPSQVSRSPGGSLRSCPGRYTKIGPFHQRIFSKTVNWLRRNNLWFYPCLVPTSLATVSFSRHPLASQLKVMENKNVIARFPTTCGYKMIIHLSNRDDLVVAGSKTARGWYHIIIYIDSDISDRYLG